MNDKNDSVPQDHEPDTSAPAADTTRELPHTAESREQPVAVPPRQWWKTPAALIGAIVVAAVLLIAGTAAITTGVTLAASSHQPFGAHGQGERGALSGQGKGDRAPDGAGRGGPAHGPADGNGRPGGKGPNGGTRPAPTPTPTAPVAP